MTSVLDKATAHFRNQISGEMTSVDVPEWEATIYFKSANTLREEGKLIELAQAGKTVEALVETLIIRARNKDGTKMFSPADKATFMNEVDPQTLIRIVGSMNQVSNEVKNAAQVEKN
jgi:hypothetical protein